LLAKKLYYNKLLLKSNNKQKTTWNLVKTITNNNNDNNNTINNISTMKIRNKLSNDPLAIANAFNSYVSSVTDNLLKNFSRQNTGNNSDPISYLHQNFSQFFFKIKPNSTSTHKIEKIIQSLRCKNSHGYDDISSRILKASAPYVLSPLTYIFSKVISTGVFPERLKYSEV
jgi:hypothetical protein